MVAVTVTRSRTRLLAYRGRIKRSVIKGAYVLIVVDQINLCLQPIKREPGHRYPAIARPPESNVEIMSIIGAEETVIMVKIVEGDHTLLVAPIKSSIVILAAERY